MNFERTPSQPPTIAPLPEGTVRPVFSVMIPTYNCSQYLVKTLRNVLAQDMGEALMQIEVIDDHSSDADVETLVRTIGNGRVKYFRQPKNVGSLRNFETCINRARGEYVHILHGDDMVHDGFYKEIEMLFEQFPTAGAAFTEFEYVNENDDFIKRDEQLLTAPGILKDWNLYIAKRQRIQPPAIVVKRSVYEHIGSFYAVHYGEDWEMWNRIANKYEVAHSPKALASYRSHNSNISTHSLLTGKNIKDINKVITIIQTYLPANKKRKIANEAKRNFATYYSHVAHRMYHDFNNQSAAITQARESLKMSINFTTVTLALKLYVKVAIGYKNLVGMSGLAPETNPHFTTAVQPMVA
ncbi:MAG TPA: glycosyltransferase [Flavipsychrobacter sp.]|nr:glycosyltransferase [Flavipsychrobacter sp.]